MTPIPFSTPGGRIVFNYLYATQNPSALTQDIVLVQLSNGIFIDVGWYPENDPAGAYYVRAYRETWQHQLLAQPIRLADPRTVAAEVSRLAAKYSTRVTDEVRFADSRFDLKPVLNTTAAISATSPREQHA